MSERSTLTKLLSIHFTQSPQNFSILDVFCSGGKEGLSICPRLRRQSEEKLQSLLMKVKEESEKIDLNLNIQKMKIMASGPITSWEIDGETVETVADFILGGSKITADGDCSHEIKRHLLLGRKLMTTLDSILKNRDITFPTKVRLVKVWFFQ